MRRMYLLFGSGLVILALVHMFATTQLYSSLTGRALWFFSGGIAMALTGALNLLNVSYGATAPGLRRVCIAANLVMTLFGIVAGIVTGASVPEFIIVVGLTAGATALSVTGKALSRDHFAEHTH